MKEFFLSLHPGARILIILVLVIGTLFVLNYQPSTQNVPAPEYTDDMIEEPAAQIVYQTVEDEARSSAPDSEETMEKSKTVSTLSPQLPVQTSQIGGSFYSIQVASSKEAARAKDLAERLKKDGFAAETVSQDIEGKGTWYRVYIGRYATKEQATAKLPVLREKYKDSFIKLRNE